MSLWPEIRNATAPIGTAESNPMKIVHPYYEVDGPRARSIVLGALTVLTLLGTFLIDLGMPDGVAAWAPYCLAIVFALVWKGALAVATVTAISMVLTLLGQWVGPIGDLQTGATNRAIGVVILMGLGLVCLYIDRTLRRLQDARDVLASSQRRLRYFVNSVNSAGIVLSDLRGRVTEWSQGAQLLTGYPSEQMVGRPLYRAFPGRANAVARWSQICHTVRRKSKAVREEAYQHRDGSWCWMHIVVKSLRSRIGRLQGYSLVLHDLTKDTPSTTRSSLKIRPMSPFLNNGHEVVVYRCRFEPRRTLAYVDAQIAHLIGVPGNGVPPLHAQALGEWIHPLDRDRVWSAIEEAVHARRPYLLVYRLTTVAGTEKWVWDEGEATETEGGIIAGLEGFLAEIG